MNRIEVRIIAAPVEVEALVRRLEDLAPEFAVVYASTPRPARKTPGAVRRYLVLTTKETDR